MVNDADDGPRFGGGAGSESNAPTDSSRRFIRPHTTRQLVVHEIATGGDAGRSSAEKSRPLISATSIVWES